MKKLVAILMFLACPAYAAEPQLLPDLSEKSTVVLNDELRKINENSSKLEARIAALETSPSTAATQAQMEAATATTVYASPGRTQYHPGVAKAWVSFNGSGVIAINTSHNVDSITDNGTGDYTVTFGTDFSTANYAIAGFASLSGEQPYVMGNANYAKAAGTVRVQVYSTGSGLVDATEVNLTAWGDQ